MHLPRAHDRRRVFRPARLGVLLTACLHALSATAQLRADNAGFALAPKGAVLAVDARGIADLLEGDRGAVVRPLVEGIAGPEALETFNMLAKRTAAGSERLAREVFAGRVAFFLESGPQGNPGMVPPGVSQPWVLGFESDDQRCEHVLRMLSAKLMVPGRYESASQRLVMRRVGGWLLIAPSDAGGWARVDAAAARIPVEDAAASLLGDPLLQQLLASDAPVRVFVRHGQPVGGATTVALRGGKRGLRAEVTGQYESMPLGLPEGKQQLDAKVVQALEDRAVLVASNLATGQPSKSDAVWLAIVPELAPPPSMRSNLAGERILAIGAAQDHPMPAVAFAWRVEDGEQAEVEQDHFMRGVCCGIGRFAEARGVKPSPSAAPDASAAARTCPELGPFADQYLGKPFKLGQSVLCWRTVVTPCGGWQIYSSDQRWLGIVADRLGEASCSDEPRIMASGIGFCDGPRAAALLRRWQPLATEGVEDRVAVGLRAVSDVMERLGRVRFRYDMGGPTRLEAVLEIEPMAQLQGTTGRPKSSDPKPPNQ